MGQRWNAVQDNPAPTWRVQEWDGEKRQVSVLCRGMTEDAAQDLVSLLNAVWVFDSGAGR